MVWLPLSVFFKRYDSLRSEKFHERVIFNQGVILQGYTIITVSIHMDVLLNKAHPQMLPNNNTFLLLTP